MQARDYRVLFTSHAIKFKHKSAVFLRVWQVFYLRTHKEFVLNQSRPSMDSCVDITPEELRAMGDYEKESTPSESAEHAFVEDLVKNNRVVVFSKSHCPHCDDSKTLLSNMGVNFKTVELDQMQEGNQVQNFLGKITDARTVPRIFIDGQCVGGNSDLKTLNNTGVLQELLKDMDS
ncbi:Glutaredoxin-2, mitochondrial [Bulinus truncatus]|nr:Glutaredoxin-2, mitochondrial [Bulinus truncatus]